MSERTLSYEAIATLLPNPVNAKDHDVDELRRSIYRLGYVEPAVIDERTGLLVSGHGRAESLVAAQLDGLDPPDGVLLDDDGTWRVPVVHGWASRDDDEAKAALVALNAVGEGLWQDDKLGPLLVALRASEGGLTGIGADNGHLGSLLKQIDKADNLDTSPQMGDMQYRVLVSCDSEQQQAELLARFEQEGLQCQALIA